MAKEMQAVMQAFRYTITWCYVFFPNADFIASPANRCSLYRLTPPAGKPANGGL